MYSEKRGAIAPGSGIRFLLERCTPRDSKWKLLKSNFGFALRLEHDVPPHKDLSDPHQTYQRMLEAQDRRPR